MLKQTRNKNPASGSYDFSWVISRFNSFASRNKLSNAKDSNAIHSWNRDQDKEFSVLDATSAKFLLSFEII